MNSVLSDRFIRNCLRASLALLAAGAVVLVIGFATNLYIIAAGAVLLIGGLLCRCVISLDRFIRWIFGRRPVRYSVFDPSDESYTCPACDYRLDGVRGPFCPECGTVRPAPREGADTSAGAVCDDGMPTR